MNPKDARIRTALPTLAGLIVALACAGCGGSGSSPQDSVSRGATGRSGSPAGGVPSQGTTQRPGLPRAADGTNVRACHDGRCEILVTKRIRIPLDARYGFRTFSFDPSDFTWRFSYPNGGSGSLKLFEPQKYQSWSGPTARQSLSFAVVASEGSKAVIALRPGK